MIKFRKTHIESFATICTSLLLEVRLDTKMGAEDLTIRFSFEKNQCQLFR